MLNTLSIDSISNNQNNVCVTETSRTHQTSVEFYKNSIVTENGALSNKKEKYLPKMNSNKIIIPNTNNSIADKSLSLHDASVRDSFIQPRILGNSIINNLL